MFKVQKIDPGSLIVMVITFVLFVGAVFTKGLSHDLLLEAGVFLVSVKLIIMNYKNELATNAIRSELKEIKELLEKTGQQ